MNVPRLHPETIDQVRHAADIVEVISDHVVLRKQGRDFVGSCPFHEDKSPSFSVSPGKQFYYCFGCGAGGNTIKFLMEFGKRSFSEVVLDLAQRYQVPVKTLEGADRQALQQQLSVREQLYEILALATRFYEHALHQSPGVAALAYLQSQRQLDLATIQQFQLGYAPAGWEVLFGYLVDQKHFPVALVEQAGLIVPRKSGGGYYDRFRDRLMIPIRDLQGRTIGFGGRTLTDEQPKYLNSPETQLFDKGKTLFGLDQARAAIVKQDQAVVVEGYFDAIALHAAGITQAVASMGTALTLDQVRQLLRYTESKQVVLNFDADAAGTKAAERAIGGIQELAYRGEVQLRVLNLPEGKDADEFLQTYSAEQYQALLAEAPLWLDWQIQQALSGQDLKQADQFHVATQQIVQLLGNLPNASLRTHYIHDCAERLSQGDSRLALQLEADLRTQVRGQRWHGRSQKWQRPADYSLREVAEAQLLRLYLHCPDYRQDICNTLNQRDLEFGLSHHRFLWRQILEVEAGMESAPVALTNANELNYPEDDPGPVPDLVTTLRDRCTEFPQEMQQVYHLFQLDEKTQLDILRPPLIIQAAAASLERVMAEKRCRHLLKLWEEASCAGEAVPGQEPLLGHYTANLDGEQHQELADEEEYHQQLQTTANPEALRLQWLFYKEKRYLQQLDQQRYVTLPDLAQAP